MDNQIEDVGPLEQRIFKLMKAKKQKQREINLCIIFLTKYH